MEFLNQPIVRNTAQQAAKNTAANVVKLGAVAGAAVFTNNVFRTLAKHTIDEAQKDYRLILDAVKNR